jgi:tRNA(fMet)-specific endonuclease VapC
VIHLDTTVLVDLLRERARGKIGPATLFLRSVQSEELCISLPAVCELFVGVELARRPDEELRAVQALCGALRIYYPDDRFPQTYAKLLTWHQRNRRTIATMDLFIATSALVEGAPLVTRNVKHFSMLPGLELLQY